MEEIKDLGGLVNQDLAFTKLPPGAVYDSENFRIVTTEGASTGARENIKGTVQVAALTSTDCAQVFTFDVNTIKSQSLITKPNTYTIKPVVDGVPVTPFVFTATPDLNDFISAFAVYLADLVGVDAVNAVVSPGGYIALTYPICKSFSNLQIEQVGGSTPTANNSKFYKLTNQDFAYSYDANNSPIDPDTNLPLSYDPWAFNLHTNTGTSNVNWPPDFTYVAGVNTSIPALTLYPTLLEYKDINTTGTIRTIRFQGYPQNAVGASSPSYFWNPTSFPLGPHQAAFSYHFENTDVLTGGISTVNSATLKVWLDLGPNVATFTAGPISTEFTTVFTSGGQNALKLFDIDLLQAGNRSRLGPGAGPSNNVVVNYTLPSSLAALGGEVPLSIIIEVKIDINHLGPANTPWDLQFYFDYLKLLGPAPPTAIPPGLITMNQYSFGSNGGNIIGWTTLRDKIYLFTTDGTYDPDDPSTWGGPTPPVTNDQIIEFTYDKSGDFSNPLVVPNNFASPLYGLKTIYRGNLGFTVQRPIANPGMIEARYESPSIQKIYWTDNWNVPRQINVADPGVAALTPEELNLQPSLSMDLPLITQVIDGGGLLVGVYQVAYRLKNINGAESRFSRTSQLVPIIDAQESGADVKSYFPRADIRSAARKSIRVKVDNLDTTYDTIEFVLLYYYDATSPPEIYIAAEEFISDVSIDTVISGNGTLIPITIDEFTAFNSSILRCKTLAAKKQTLFLGNITVTDQVIDFDARAYRFPINSSTTTVRDNLNNPVTLTYNSGNNSFTIGGNNIDKTEGAYQTYEDQDPEVDTNSLYQPGTNILGGQGPNVKYEFFTETIPLSPLNSTPPAANSLGSVNPLVNPNTSIVVNFSSIDRSYVSDGASLSSYGSPYVYDMYIGYRRDEMYRFGIVFFDQLDNPTYVNWIGDIRMPHTFMPSTTANSTNLGNRSLIGDSLNADFTSSPFYLWDNPGNPYWHDVYAKPLGVKFTIDFSSVADKYKKAAIVRAPLEEKDKHVLGQGIFLPTYKTSGLGAIDGEHVFLCSNYTVNAADPFPPAFGGTANNIWPDCFTLRSPEFLFKPFPGYVGGDTVDVFGIVRTPKFDYLMGQNGANVSFYSRAVRGRYHSSGGGNHRFTATISCAYDMVESATYPATIKNVNSENPYELATAFQISGKSNDREYRAGNTTTVNGAWNVARVINGCSPKDTTAVYGGGVSTPTLFNGVPGGFAYVNNCLFLQTKNSFTENWNLTGFGGNEFYNIDPWQNTANRYIANYKRNIVDPYGGQDYFSRANTEYIACNNLIDISNKATPITTKVFGGDTRISVFDHVTGFVDRAEASASGNNQLDIYTEYIYMPVETSVAIEYRRSSNDQAFSTANYGSGVPNRNWVFCAWGDVNSAEWYSGVPTKLESEEYFFVDPVFNYSKKTPYTYFPEPALGSVPTIYDCRVWRSEKKIDGEVQESWSVFKPLAFLDVESAYGPINNLIIFQDKLYYFQDRGFGVLQVADQKLITDASGDSDLVLGNSGLLERYDYISTKTGTKHQFSMHVSDYSMVWFDILARKMYRYKPGALEPLSDIKGLNAYLYERTKNRLQRWDNPYLFKGIHSTYDYRYNEFYMTFLNDVTDFNVQSAGDGTLQFTLVYNDLMDGYVGRYTHHPKVYINDKINIFSTLGEFNNDGIFMHNVGYYGVFYYNTLAVPSKLSFVVNSNPTVEKTFTNLEFVVEAFKPNTYSSESNNPLTLDPYNYKPFAETRFNDFFTKIRVYDNYQNTDWQMLAPISRRHKTIWNVKVPTDRVINLDVFSGTLWTSGNIFNPDNLVPPGARPKFTRRLKDKWFVVDLSYSNALYQDPLQPRLQYNHKLIAYTAKAIYTPNSR